VMSLPTDLPPFEPATRTCVRKSIDNKNKPILDSKNSQNNNKKKKKKTTRRMKIRENCADERRRAFVID
jgi:hypothetical protein